MPGNQTNGANFASLFAEQDVLCRTPIRARDELLRAMLTLLAYRYGIGNVDAAYEAVLTRENRMSTIVAPGIAVPHARLEAVSDLHVCVATSPEGIPFGAPEPGQPPESMLVHLVILILAPKDQPGAYLQAVSSFARMLSDPKIAWNVADLGSSAEVLRFFGRGGLILPDYVCAGDIMNRGFASLQETDTLEHAIDMLVHHNLIDLPVLDKERKMMGVVTVYELLRVCLPDYILWMEDLSPILNFEPFAQVLRNEGKTWLTEIMSLEFATVPEEAPAIQVATEMARRSARQVFVVRDEQCVGVITLQDFVHKVLRE